nr:hypothetical protein [Bacteroidota bacterium]
MLLKKWGDYELYFIEKEKIERINYLETLGVKWIKKEYKEFSQYRKGLFLSPDFAAKIYEKAKGSRLNSEIDALLLRDDAQRLKMDVVWKYYLLRGIEAFADQYAAAEYLYGTGRYGSVTVVSHNSLAYFLKDSLKRNVKTFILPGLFYKRVLKKATAEINRICAVPFRRAKAFFSEKKTISEKAPKVAQPFVSKSFDLKTVEVVYFPHQGIYYSDLFKKDHFYSKDKDSPFHRSKILHTSLGEKNESYMFKNYEYYLENNIPFTDISDMGYSKKELFKSFFSLIKRMNVGCVADLFKYGFGYLLFGFRLYYMIERYLLIFSRFKNLKIALSGYDYLFPRDLSIALSILDVKVCATQERLIQAFLPDNYSIFDYYFVAGKAVKDRGLKNSQIEHCIPVGMVREDLLYDYEHRQMYDEKYDTIKKQKKLVLALDYHIPENIIDDISRSAAKIMHTRQFYRDLICLARDFPSLHIVIKGKGVDSYRSCFISDIVDEIKGIYNLEIELNLKRYNPYFLSEKADLTIACYTSLCDELLAADRKVIFYETTDFMNTVLNYDNLPIIVYDYPELKKHIENFLEGRYLERSITERLKEEFYNNCYHGRVRKNILSVLEKVFDGKEKKMQS